MGWDWGGTRGSARFHIPSPDKKIRLTNALTWFKWPLLSYEYSPNLPLKFSPPPLSFQGPANGRAYSTTKPTSQTIQKDREVECPGQNDREERGARKQKWNNKQTMEHGSSLRSLSLFLLSPWQAKPANNKENEKQQTKTAHDPNTKTHTPNSHLCREFFFSRHGADGPPSLGYASSKPVLLAAFHRYGSIFWGNGCVYWGCLSVEQLSYREL